MAETTREKTNQSRKERKEGKLLPNVLQRLKHHDKRPLQLENLLGLRRVKRRVLSQMMTVLKNKSNQKNEVVQLEKLLQQAKAENALESLKQHNKRKKRKHRSNCLKMKLKSLIKGKTRLKRI